MPVQVPDEVCWIMEDPLHRDTRGLMRPDVVQVRCEVTVVLVDGAGCRDH